MSQDEFSFTQGVLATYGQHGGFEAALNQARAIVPDCQSIDAHCALYDQVLELEGESALENMLAVATSLAGIYPDLGSELADEICKEAASGGKLELASAANSLVLRHRPERAAWNSKTFGLTQLAKKPEPTCPWQPRSYRFGCSI